MWISWLIAQPICNYAKSTCESDTPFFSLNVTVNKPTILKLSVIDDCHLVYMLISRSSRPKIWNSNKMLFVYFFDTLPNSAYTTAILRMQKYWFVWLRRFDYPAPLDWIFDGCQSVCQILCRVGNGRKYNWN